MKNYYTNLNQLRQSNDGQPTVNRQSRLMSHQGYLRNLAMIFAVLVMSIANIGMAWGASVAEGTFNWVNQTIGAAKKFYKIDNGIYQYRLNAYTKNSSLGIQLPASGDGTGFVFHLESTQKVYIGICKKNVKTEVVNNLYIKTITEANFSAIEAGTNNNTAVTLSLAGSATLSQNYTFAAISSQKTEGATVYMGELPAGYYYAYGNSTGGNGNLYSITFGTQTLFLVPNDKAGDNAKFAAYYYIGNTGYERIGWSDYMTVSPCNSSTYRVDIPKGYTKLIFVRLNPSGGINWDSKWNQTGDLTFDGSKDLFTWANGSWDGATTTWSASTKYTISFASNGGSGSMSNVSSIACGRSVTVAANAYTKSGYSFTGWKANVDVKVGGSTKTAGTLLADGVTIQDISSNITLTAQWEADAPACSAPTSPSISGTTSYTAGDNISLTASATGTSGSTTYTWYKGADWATASASSPVQATSTSGATFTKNSCVAGDAGTYWCNISNGTGCDVQVSQAIMVSAGCAASAPGNISKGEASGGSGTITLTSAGSPVSGDTWYWQASASGTSKSESGATKNVNAAGTYYIRSYNSSGDCWSDAKSVTVAAADLLTPITLSLSYDNPKLVLTALTTATPTLTGNAGSGSVSYVSGTPATATVNGSTGVVSAVAAGTTTITVNVGANGNYAAGSTTATIKVVAAPLGIVDQKLATGSVAWDASDIVTSDYTNITGLSAFAAQGGLSIDGGNGTTSSGTALTAKVEASGGTSKADSKYMEFHFTVAAGKRLHVTAINAVVRSVSNDRVYYATLTGTTGSITKTTTVTEATAAGADIFAGQSYDEYFTGTVSFKLWAYSTSSQTKNLWYRIGSNIYITGTIEDDCSTPAAPTNFTAGDISATGATFTITDAADAASYDIYYSTSSSAPEASTPATTTSTSKTKEVTGLTAATTYYAWVRSVCDASHKSAWVALNPGGDTHTFATSCVAPATVNVTATVNSVAGFQFYPDDDVVLTAAPTGSPAGSPVTYQWKKNGSNVGTNNATLTINDAAASDAGKYTCTISYGACSTTSAEFELKCMQFYLKNSGGSDISNHVLEKVDATHATLSLSLTGGTTYKFRVTDGCNNWYGNSDETGMTSSNCSNWTMPHDADCKVTTSSKSATYTFNFDFSAGLLGSEMKVSVVYPAGDQAAGKVIYWDNSVLNWASAPWYRIGKGTHNNKTQMTLVPGTANLYKVTTTEYNGFEYWHIANNEGEGTGNIFWTKDSDPTTNEEITNAMGFEGSPVTAAAVTFTPTLSHATGTSSDNDNCEFYEYGQQNGMKRDRVTITAPVNGTITVNYTSEEDVASSFSATTVDMYQDLAHSVILTSITATPNTGYDAGAITINTGAYSANYVVTGATTIAASFTPHVYSITYKDQDNVAFSGEHAAGHPTTHTYGSATTLKTASKTGYTFGGWYTSSDCSTGLVTSLGATAYTADITLYAKWTEEVAPTDVCWDPATTPADKLAKNTTTLTTLTSRFAAIDGVTSVTVDNPGTGNGQCAGSDDDSGYLKVKNATTNKIITIVTTAPTNITIGGKKYGDNTGSFYLVKSTDTETKLAECNTNAEDEATNLPAGTYYIYAKASTKSINFSKLCIELYECSTPAAPTAFANTAVTSTTATFSITDAADAASYDLYYASGSPSTPTAGTNATENVTTKTPTITGLTASTTYKIWARSVCDADHKSAWVALGTTSFTTVAAEPEALIHWIVTVDASTWSLNGSPTTTDGTNITSISSSIDAASSPSTGASGTTAKVALAAASDNVSNAASFTFTVNSAKKVEPERVTCQVFNVGSGSGDQLSYKAQLSDNNGHVYYSTNSVKPASAATLTDATFTFASDLVLTGNVTMKVYGYQDGGTKGTAFRMGADVKLFGEVQNAADYTVTHTLSNVTKSAGATSVKEGNNYTATYAGAGGSALPSMITVTIGGSPATAGTDYTWTQGTGVVTIPGNKVTGNIVITVTGVAPAPTYSVTHTLTNVTATSGATGAGAATEGVAYNAVFAANTGYVLPSTITVTIDGSPATVGTGYTWNASTGAFQVPAAQVTGAIVVTIAGDEIEGDGCEELVNVEAATATTTTDNVGSSTVYNASGQTANSKSIKLNSSGYIELSPKAGKSFAAGDSLIIVMWNQASSAKTTGYRIAGTDYTASMPSKVNTTFRRKLIAADIVSSKVKIERESGNGSNAYFVSAIIKHCEDLPSCTPPTLPTLSNQTVCPGSDIAAWNAEPTNIATITGASQDVAYSWKKKGSDTELAATASFDLGSSATEGMAGTYVVTVTVSKTGYISKSASAEVDLTVTPATETPSITASKAKVYATDEVIFTATCGSTGVTWQWYRCTNAGGTITGSCLSTTSSYTLASAPAAGTYYYKAVATGDGTHSCGAAEYVYTLVVSADNSCDKEFWFAKEGDRPTGAASATHITGCPSGSSSASYTASIDGTNYTLTGSTGQKTGNVTIVVPADNTGTLYVVVQGSSSRTITLSKGGVQVDQQTPTNSVWGVYTVSDLDAGTYTLVSSGNISWGIIALKLCPTAACTDDTPTATATSETVCAGGTITITATGYETGATFQWQKQNASTSAWEDIDGATSATYSMATAAAEHAGNYHIVATKECARTSNTVTISVPSAPNFGSTVPASVSVMQTIALSINTVEATDAVKYKWYKSADDTWDAGDTEIGTNKELIKAYDSEAIGSPSYYIFCRAQNACGIATSTAIAVNVTAYVEEDCATRGNESDAEFGFQNSGCGQGTYNSASCWTMNSNSKILIYSAPDGKYFKTMKVTIASSSASKASYNWSTNGGTTYTSEGVAITGVTTTLTEKTINLSAHGNVNEVKIGRNFGNGESSGTLYVSKICFEYTDACTATTVTPSGTGSETHTIGSSFTEPTFTVKHGGTAFDPQPEITYTSSNEDIASVDDDGTVTFNGEAGIVTITAAYAGNATYCASEGSYTITVSCPGGAPKVVASGSVDMSGCNSSVILNAKTQAGADFADGTYQWFRNGEEIDGATSSSYTATQAGTYTVERTNTSDCTTPSTNSAVVTSETTEPEVERLVPFQYYHVDKTYTDQMKMRHLFAVKNSGTLDGKHFKMYVSRNGGAATDVTSSNALVVWPNGDGHVDTVMVDLNKLSGKYEEDDELVFTCKAIDCTPAVSETYKATITMHVIDETPTLALICSGSSKAEGTRKTGELTVGGDFLTGYNVADLCQQTGNTSFDANTEWGLYTDLKAHYIVTPVNGYAVFNKLNYEPFDILLLTDYPKASKSDAAAAVLDDMAALCDYRPMLSFKTHMVAKSPSKWAEKGFTTSPVVTKADGRLNLNIVCYAHPMFEGLKSGEDVYEDADNTSAPLVYTMLTGGGYESSKGMQGFELAAAENFVTIGLTHYNGTITKNSPLDGEAEWSPGSEDRMLVTVAERQTNIEARFILFSINCGAQSKLTDRGEQVILACLEYLLDDDPLHVADCSFTFDNGASNEHDAAWYSEHCNTCTGTKGDGKWTTAANWGPDYRLLPGEFTSVRIKAPVEVNDEHAHVMEVRIIDEGSINIPAGKALDVKSTIRRMDGSEIYPTEIGDIHIGSASTGNGTLIFNNDEGDTKARVDMYSNALADVANMSAATSTWQYIGTPHSDVANARYNYYNSWLYQYSGSGWEVIPNGGPLVPFRGYCVTHPDAPVVFSMEGTLAATTSQDIAIPAGYTVIANSWVAPIDINAITDDDMEGITDKTIYFFNTGSDADGSGGIGTEAGTYRTTPIHSASYTGDWQIPSMQGFYISTETAGTLHLDYDRHVRPTGSRSLVSNPMYAPRRAVAESGEPAVLKIFARGSRYQDKLVVLEREDFTRGYDSGWDGEAWGGGTLSPMVYVTGDGREDAVSAIPEFEGTVIAFKAGEDSEYRFEFTYSEDAEPLYLLDTENNTYTQVITGNAYYFTTTDKVAHSRFVLTRKNPQIATDIEPVSGSPDRGKAKKLLIEDKMFIMVNGMLYDATGKVVK